MAETAFIFGLMGVLIFVFLLGIIVAFTYDRHSEEQEAKRLADLIRRLEYEEGKRNGNNEGYQRRD